MISIWKFNIPIERRRSAIDDAGIGARLLDVQDYRAAASAVGMVETPRRRF
jgi:hypothetical protein